MNDTKIRKRLVARAKEFNDPWDRQRSVYQEIKDYIVPWCGHALSNDGRDEMMDGAKKDDNIYDPIATYAVEVLAAGMQSGLTSPSRPWFRLGLPNRELAEQGDVKAWLYQVEEGMRFVFSRSNIYQGLHHTYRELGAFGTGAMALFEDFNTVIRARPFTCGEYRLAVGADLKVDAFYAPMWMTARQIVERFGKDNVSPVVKEAYDKGQAESLFQVAWLTEPNDDRMEAKDFLNRAYRSVWYEVSSSEDKLLNLSGFPSFVVLCPRWDVVAGRIYGSGPGHATLSNVKMLQKMQEKGLIALDLLVDPSLVGPSTLKQTSVNTMPGGITAIDEMSTQGQLRALREINPAIFNPLEAKIANVQAQIRTGFYNDLFLMLATQPMRAGVTATEIAERHEEKLVMLGPVLERLHTELLDPLIDRTFEVMVSNDLIPPPPESIAGEELRVEYISMLATAQKMVGTAAVNQFVGFVGSLAEANPEILDKVDFDEAVDVYADMTGVPPSLVVPDEEAAAKRQQRAQQQMAQQMAAMMQPAAQATKAMADADMGGNNALNALLGRPPMPGQAQ